jgi:hypothetical protein
MVNCLAVVSFWDGSAVSHATGENELLEDRRKMGRERVYQVVVNANCVDDDSLAFAKGKMVRDAPN